MELTQLPFPERIITLVQKIEKRKKEIMKKKQVEAMGVQEMELMDFNPDR